MEPENSRDQYFAEKYKGRIIFAGPKHGRIRQVENLLKNTKPNPQHLFIVEGIWAHALAYKYNLKVESFVFCPELIFSPEAEKVVQQFVERATEACLASRRVFQKISERERPDGLLAVCQLPLYGLEQLPLGENCLLIVLDGLEIPGNIGTIVRAADGAGADGIIIVNRKARLTHPKLLKSSQGASFVVPIVETELDTALTWLKDNKFSVYLTDTRAETHYYQQNYQGRCALVAGSERYGISRDWYDRPHTKISIPMHGDCDSLNVAVATTIMLYEASLQLKGAVNREQI